MAEVVQYHLEQMVDELEDLEQRGLFSKAELKTIVKKRTKYEYALRRRRVNRAAFLQYIEYEINVDALRRQRKQRLSGAKRREKTTLSDFSITQRVISIFERALVKHPEDSMLWLQYIEFIKARRRMVPDIGDEEESQGHSRLLSSVFARAITAHPYESQMWIKAAAHELDINANSSAARILLQRALRLIPDDQRLWIEYFRLEMLLVEKIKARRRVLGIDQSAVVAEPDTASVAENIETEASENSAFIDLPQLDEEENSKHNELQVDTVEERFAEQALARLDRKAATGTSNLSEDERAAMAQQTNAYLQGAVAQVVYEQAIKAIPASLEFRQELASVVAMFSDTERLRQVILTSIHSDFKEDAQARAYLCSAHLASVPTTSPELVDGLQSAVSNFKTTLEELDNPDMWTEYVRFLTQWRDACASMESLRAYFGALIDRAVAQIGEQKNARLNAELALICADNIQTRMKQQNAGDADAPEMRLLNWLADATQRFPTSADLWHRRLSLLLAANADSAASVPANVASDSRLDGLFTNQALAQVPASKKLWNLFLDWIEQRFSKGLVSADHVQSRYFGAFARTTQQRSVLALSTDESALPKLHELMAHLQIRYLDWAWGLPLKCKQLSAIGDISLMALADADVEEEESSSTPENSVEKRTGNVEALRQAYHNVSRHAFPTLLFYKRCLEREPDMKNKIMLHEMACRVDESDMKPWLAYLAFLNKIKELSQASTVYWRAAKAMGDSRQLEFETAYQNLLHKPTKAALTS
ncbi:U3 snoRNP protein [Coemansia guatemalensis]|uniref:U3 snoRNP protein n=1 Tax=Coemansia guatemalensis TaxID=2761395 RepID=A0A9W8I270_9FUNG|nr:U3 snoRNP protein [Coemansia guatemalensis]